MTQNEQSLLLLAGAGVAAVFLMQYVAKKIADNTPDVLPKTLDPDQADQCLAAQRAGNLLLATYYCPNVISPVGTDSQYWQWVLRGAPSSTLGVDTSPNANPEYSPYTPEGWAL